MVRLSNQYLLDYAGILSNLFQGDFVKGLVFLAITHANVGHIEHDAALSRLYGDLTDIRPDALRRPIRPYPLAQSLGLPRERVRRKVVALVADGFLEAAPLGMIAPARVFARDDMRSSILANSALVVRLYKGLARAGVDNAPPPIDGDLDIADLPNMAISRVTARFWLRAMDEICKLFPGDLLTGLTYVGVINANTSYLNALDDLPYADIDDHVPDSARRPITAIALAAELGLPRESVRRHVRALENLGVCQVVKKGLIVPEAVLRQPNMVGPTLRTQTNIRLLLSQLQTIGFPPPWSVMSDDRRLAKARTG
jgi:predicted transcriptional regulator